MEKLTQYERTRMLSARALQISDGAEVYLDNPKEKSTIILTEEEFKKGKTPLKIVKK
ncbi:MAG: DNA-directed RNA polymerase subunit K [Candidatus Diapherotrites archaeon CG08_land_8_20_14_0_20_30_16]|nr:MAG: DNA-directed RNA polymerase subunit K [Candidatus Diapherotrites archaeon CG08_land_8_20_14_0_20_30_16]